VLSFLLQRVCRLLAQTGHRTDWFQCFDAKADIDRIGIAGAVTFRLDEMHPGPRRRFRKITVGKREEDEQTYRALAETIRFDPRPGPSTTTVAPLLTRL
jgi:hypothetical protein